MALHTNCYQREHRKQVGKGMDTGGALKKAKAMLVQQRNLTAAADNSI
jgi:hypothetical protein